LELRYYQIKGISDQNFNEALGELVNLENYILIFDDLERCNMNVNEILGYINSFVEHDKVKTLIVANQKEIGKINTLSNLELKYLLSVQDNIQFDEDTERDNDPWNSREKKSEPKKLEISEIHNRTEKLFGENLLYNQTKEKLIGTTIYFKPDMNNAISSITDKYIEDKILRKNILDNKDYISNYLNEQQHHNLRTLQFFINIYKTVGDIIIKSDIDDAKGQDKVLKEILKYLFICFNKI